MPPDPNASDTTGPGRQWSGLIWWVATAMAAVAGAILVFVATSRNGPGISPDSVNYIGAARDLLHDGDMEHMRFGSSAFSDFTLWPPLYPALIALFSLGPGDFIDAARLVNVLAYGATIGVAGIWIVRVRLPAPLSFLALIAVTLAFPLYLVSTYAWSEPLFSLFLLVTSVLTARYWRSGTFSALTVAAAAAALAALSRYVGPSVIGGAGMVILLRPGKPLFGRLKDGAIFGVIAATPIGLWMLRNEHVNGTLTGRRIGDLKAPWSVVRKMPVIVGNWYAPRDVPAVWESRIALLLLGAVLLVVWTVIVRGVARQSIFRAPEVISLSIITLVYLIQIPYSVANFSGDPISSRFLAPISVPLLLLICTSLAALWQLLEPILSKRMMVVVEMACCAMLACWLLVPIHQINRDVDRARANGVGGYSTNFWAHSALVAYLRTANLNGALVSNYSEGIVIRAEIPTYSIGTRGNRTRLNELVPLVDSGPTYLVWVTQNGERSNRNSLADVQKAFVLTPYFQNEEGTIYLMSVKRS